MREKDYSHTGPIKSIISSCCSIQKEPKRTSSTLKFHLPIIVLLTIGFLGILPSAKGANFFWDNGSGNGLYTTSTNWTTNTAPSGTRIDIHFENNYGTGAETVSLNSSSNVREINFDNPTAYTINNNTFTFNSGSGTHAIFAGDANGAPTGPITHTINSNIVVSSSNFTLENTAVSSNVNVEIAGTLSLGTTNVNLNGNGSFEVSGVISGSGQVLKTSGSSTGTFTLSGNNTYTGVTTVSTGILKATHLNALGSSSTSTTISSGGTVEYDIPAFGFVNEDFTIAGTGSAGQGALVNSSSTSVFFGGDVKLSANATVSNVDSGGFLLLNGDVFLQTNTLTVNIDNGSAGFGTNTVISGTGGLIKTGTGIVSFRQSGTTDNTYTGLTEVQAGTLSTATSIDGLDLITGDIKISGGTLALLHDNNVVDTSDVELAGGTLRFQASGSGSTDVEETFNTLTLTDDSTIELNNIGAAGTGIIVANFADSSATSWTSGKTLTIENWDGTLASGGGEDQIFFGNSSSGLTSTQLSQIKFLNPAGQLGIFDAAILANGEIVPVPEPSTYIIGGLLLLLIAYIERKRVKALAIIIQSFMQQTDPKL